MTAVFIGFLVVAMAMMAALVFRNRAVIQRTAGEIREADDLREVRGAINLSMRLAIAYIVLYVLFFVALVFGFLRGMDLAVLALYLFLWGVLTLPAGLLGKHYERKIKYLRVTSKDPEIQSQFMRYLREWSQLRLQLSP